MLFATHETDIASVQMRFAEHEMVFAQLKMFIAQHQTPFAQLEMHFANSKTDIASVEMHIAWLTSLRIWSVIATPRDEGGSNPSIKQIASCASQ
jgi:hypothetical protein